MWNFQLRSLNITVLYVFAHFSWPWKESYSIFTIKLVFKYYFYDNKTCHFYQNMENVLLKLEWLVHFLFQTCNMLIR